MHITKRLVKRSVLVLLSLVLAAMLLVSFYAQSMTSAFAADYATEAKKFYTDFETFEEEQEAANSFNVEMASEGDVLLKNRNNALPLQSYENKVSVFGVRSTDLQYGGGGSGSGDSSTANTLQESLTSAGFDVNPSLTTFYRSYQTTGADIPLEAPNTLLDTSCGASYGLYSDVAIIVISRAGSEGTDMKTNSIDGNSDVTRHELELTEAEDALVEHVTEMGVFGKVIVLVNASNPMELGKLQYNDEIDGILWIGHVGTSGIMAVGKILNGEVNPSGRLVDIYPADFAKDPTWYNFGDNTQNHYNAATKTFDATYIQVRSEEDSTKQYSGYNSVDYEEGIYMGYRWYETADAEGYFDRLPSTVTQNDAGMAAHDGDAYYNTYNGVVYPFGYGLSYTEFSYDVTTSGGTWNGTSDLTVSVTVTNDGEVAGKDVVQLYSSAPYYAGGIEKSAADLVDYQKTSLLQPSESETITFTVSPQQLASFDDGIWGDDNINGAYVLDPGAYVLSVRSDSHTVEDSVTFTLGTAAADAEEAAENAVAILYDETTGGRIQTYYSADDGYNNTTRTTLVSKTAMDVTARTDFQAAADNATLYSDNHGLYHPLTATVDDLTYTEEALAVMDGQMRSVDGVDSQANNSVSYIDNMDGNGDPSTINTANNANNNNTPWVVTEDYVRDLGWSQATEEDVAARKDGKTAIQLYQMAGVPFDDEKWVSFMNQLTYDELISVFNSNRFWTLEMPAIGKPASVEADGPGQLQNRSGGRGTFWVSEVVIASTWNPDLGEKQGWFIGNESMFLDVNGWYGPGINTHRSPFGGRNFEYYSSDGVQGGKIFAGVVKGAQAKGVHVYAKHFFLNDQEMGRDVYGGICTWATEQAIRQIYIKVVEEAIKEYNLNGLMTSFNRIGMISSATAGAYLGILENEYGYTGGSNTDFYLSGQGGSAWSANRLIRAHVYPLGTFEGTNVISGEYREDANGDGMVWITEDVDAEGNAIPAFESPSQWKAVRELAQRALYVACNSNLMKNGIDTSAFVDSSINVATGVEPTANIAVDEDTFGEEALTVKYTLASGQVLPEGLTLSEDGTISGKTNSVGTFEVGVVMTVDNYITKQATLTVNVSPSLELSATTVAAGAAYEAQIESEFVYQREDDSDSVGYDTFVYEITAGALPAGIVMDEGKFMGSSTEVGTYNFTIEVTATRRNVDPWGGVSYTTDIYTQDLTLEVTGGGEADLEGQISDLQDQIDDLQAAIDAMDQNGGSDTTPDEEAGGCGSTLFGGTALIGSAVILAAAVCFAIAKKRTNK